jgi:hypothetical protein
MGAVDGMDARFQPVLRACSSTWAVARGRRSGEFIVALVALALLGTLLLLGSGCGAVSADGAHSLPSEVPLPAQRVFVKQTLPGCSTCTGQSWYFTLASTLPQQVASFYVEQLPKRGWQEVDCQLYSPEHVHCLARDGHRLLTIMGVSQPLFDIAPPRGGVVLAITLIDT